MRRYAVRFLVALLTFGIGVVLSFAFGLFKVQETRFVNREWSSCRKKVRVSRPAFLTVDTQPADPLKLVYLGTTPDTTRGDAVRMRFAVTNNSGMTVSGYWITASEIWESKGKSGARDADWTAFEILEPGETSTISLPRNTEGSSLRVVKVNFQDGSTWINPRASQ